MNLKFLIIIILGIVIIGCETTGKKVSSKRVRTIPDKIITSSGIGRPPPNSINPTQSQKLAREMAKTEAMKIMRRKIQTMPVVGRQTVQQRISRNPSSRAKVENVIQNAKIVTDKLNADGTWLVEISILLSDLRQACR